MVTVRMRLMPVPPIPRSASRCHVRRFWPWGPLGTQNPLFGEDVKAAPGASGKRLDFAIQGNNDGAVRLEFQGISREIFFRLAPLKPVNGHFELGHAEP